MTTTVTITHDNFDRILAQFSGAVSDIVQETIDDVDAEVKRMMNEPKSGRWYGNHQASAPGEAPAVDSEKLINSLTKKMVTPAHGVYYTEEDKAPILEFGGGRILPRPFMGPAAEAQRPSFMEKMSNLERRLR